ncbi:protein CsuE [Halomonas elongata]|uniref:Csu type fimbrial protein n=1 Tax=Halomonas elongata TaxID=2746 RepID=UPI000DCDF129|nr:spore coat U domain-containing protein [Halomonas elongata]RAW08682.1 protein CsuE [Halomonas elongata]
MGNAGVIRLGWRSLVTFCLLLAVVCGTNSALACDVVAPNPLASFGVASSLTVAGSAQQTSAQPNAGVECSAPILSVLGSDYVNATITSANGGQLQVATGDTIDYDISADPGGEVPLTLGTTYDYYNATLLDLLGLLGSSDPIELPMYFRTLPGSADNIAAGLYIDTLTVNWNWSVCEGIGIGGLCLGRDNGSGTSTVTLQLEVLPDCVIDAPDLDFGSAPLVAGFSPVTRTLSVRCTKGQAYSVGLSDGQHAASGQRRMASSGEFLRYELYKGASGLSRWGRQGAERRDSTQADNAPGNHDGVTAQGFIYRGIIDDAQSTPPAGVYTDTVVVDIEF